MRLNCVADTTGPMLLVGSRGSPTTTVDAAADAMAAASSMRAAGTSMRVGALHDWPELVHMPAMSREMAASRSASSRMMLADLPPSSWATRLTVGAAARATSMPARVDPVNDIMSMSGWADSTAPTLIPSPLTRLNTPAGTPASSMISAKRMALSGATSDGLSTIVQPAASAGATLQAIWLSGQFQGVIIPHTPMGSRTSRVLPIDRVELEVGEHGAGGAEVRRGPPRPGPPAPTTTAHPSPG